MSPGTREARQERREQRRPLGAQLCGPVCWGSLRWGREFKGIQFGGGLAGRWGEDQTA